MIRVNVPSCLILFSHSFSCIILDAEMCIHKDGGVSTINPFPFADAYEADD